MAEQRAAIWTAFVTTPGVWLPEGRVTMRSRRYVTEHISVECPECQGQGYGGPEYEPCPYCGGDCWQYRERDVTAAFDALLQACQWAVSELQHVRRNSGDPGHVTEAERCCQHALALARGEGSDAE